MNYEQQLNKILNPKGCEKSANIIAPREYPEAFCICGKEYSGEIALCPICEEIQQAQKETLLMCAKDELEFLINDLAPNNNGDLALGIIEKRISQLQEVIKRLEEMK